MYASNSPPPWRAGTPRASFSSLQQQHHVAVEPVQHHHQDKLYILGKVAMKKRAWSRSGLSFSFWVDLVLACITAFGVFGCTAFIILPINFEDTNKQQIYLKTFTYLGQFQLLFEPMQKCCLIGQGLSYLTGQGFIVSEFWWILEAPVHLSLPPSQEEMDQTNFTCQCFGNNA